MPVVSTQCVIGTGKYPDAGLLLNFDDDDYAQGYHQIKEAFKALTKDDILQPYISEEDFRSSNAAANDVGYNLYALVLTNKLVSISSDGQRHFDLI